MLTGHELIPRLEELYRDIDVAYSAHAQAVGFSCYGCDGAKCCTVDLILHTHTEKLYLRRGFDALESEAQASVRAACRSIIEAKEHDPHGNEYRSSVCALNADGLCMLYEFRPMICRLAGIPHSFVRPDGKPVLGPGCPRYKEDKGSPEETGRLDRTNFYQRLAEIEIEMFRKIRSRAVPETVAEVLSNDPSANR